MFPTTIWTTIVQAGEKDQAALERFAEDYRPLVLQYVRRRGFSGEDAEDICQDVFVRLLTGEVLAKAEQSKGRFRSLLLSVARHTILDRLRKRREQTSSEIEVIDRDPEFDQAWTLHLTERALGRLREQGSPYYEVLRAHLGGEKQNRNKLWIARRKLIAQIRAEVAGTCRSRAELDEELAYLSTYLERNQKSAGNSETEAADPR